MATVTISPQFEVVIPEGVREALHLKPGQELTVFVYDGRIELVPAAPIEETRGFLEGMDTGVERGEDRM